MRNSEYNANMYLVPQRAEAYHLESDRDFARQRDYEDAARMRLNLMRHSQKWITRRTAGLVGILLAEVIAWIAINWPW